MSKSVEKRLAIQRPQLTEQDWLILIAHYSVDMCRWKEKEEDTDAYQKACANYYRVFRLIPDEDNKDS